MGIFKGFTQAEVPNPERSVFDLSHERKSSTRIGRLTPIFCEEALPNDTWRLSSEVLLRMAPLFAPLFHRIKVYVHFFGVPMRLLHRDWEAMITGGRLGTETPPVFPYVAISDVLDRTSNFLAVGSNSDHLGMQTIADSSSAAWSNRYMHIHCQAAFYRVWYDFYRDRNFHADNDYLPLASGALADSDVIDALFVEYYRAWQPEYFTSALPFTQRGAEVLIPMVAQVNYLDQSQVISTNTGNPINTDNTLWVEGSSDPGGLRFGDSIGQVPARIENIDSIENSSVTMNDFRRALALQRYLEINAVGGSRYNEWTWANFKRRTSDARIQQAEYLGGGVVDVKIDEVVTTAYSQDADSATVPPANPTGRAMSLGKSNQFTYNCEEHMVIIGVMSVLPNTGYIQGARRRFFSRQSFLDWPIPTLAHLGEQEVYDYELNAGITTVPVGNMADPAYPVFGYQSRYADWKYIPSSVHGDFKTTLSYWHLDRDIGEGANLNEPFLTFNDEIQNRIFSVSEVDTIWCYIYNRVTVKRSLPYIGTPKLVG